MADGTVQVWGDTSPQPPAGLANVQQIAAGTSHCLALMGGQIVGWGDNTDNKAQGGQGLTGVKYIAAGANQSGAILADGSIKMWGNGFAVPNPPAGNDFIQLSIGYTNAMAVRSDHTIVSWGTNSFGGNNPPMGASGANLAQVATRHQSCFALTQDGNVYGWGEAINGHTTIPAHMYDLQSVGGGYQHVVFLKHDGTLLGWGDNFYNQCNVPTPPAGKKFTSLFVGYNHAAAFGPGIPVGLGLFGDDSYHQLDVSSMLPTIDTLWAAGNTTYAHVQSGGTVAWGMNIDGELGLHSPTFNPSLVTGGGSNVFAIAQGAVSGVGTNGAGQLALPASVSSGVTQVSTLNNHVLALKGQHVVAWGDDNWNQIDIPNNVATANIVQVSAGWEHSLALGVDGTVYAWGAPYDHQTSVPNGLTGQAQIAATGWFNVTMPKVALSVVPYNIISQSVGIGTVYIPLPQALPTVINLSSNSNSVFFDQGTVTIPAGSTSKTFNVHALAVLSPIQVLITATLGNCVQTSMVTVTPPSFSISTNVPSVVGGSTSPLNAILTLTNPAPLGGVDIPLMSNDPSLVPPASVHFNSGQTTPATQPVVIVTNQVSASKTVTLSGTYLNQTISCKVTVLPFQVVNFSILPSTRLAGMQVLGGIGLNAMPKSPVNVSFTSSNPSLLPNVPSMSISTQYQTVYFNTNPSATTTSITITASLNGSMLSYTFPLSQTFSAIVFSSGTWYGATNTVITAYLAQPCGSGGLTVNLSTDSNCMAPTTQLFFVSGVASSGNVAIAGNDVAVATPAKVTISLGNVSFSATKTIVPNAMTTMVVSPSTYSASQFTQRVSVNLSIITPELYDDFITIVSSNPSVISSPGVVKIPQGQNSTGNLTLIRAKTVAKTTVVTLTATRLGQTIKTNVTVNP